MMGRTAVLLVFSLLVPIFECIIRNDISDRCLHLRPYDRMKDTRKLPVYGRGCSWDSPEQGTSSHKNEHVEIVASSEFLQNQPKYIIRRVFETDDLRNHSNSFTSTCLSSLNNEPSSTSSCEQSMFHPKSLFSIDPVPQSNFRGYLTSASSFKIKNEGGDCLTVKPGSELLLFRKCSSRYGLFQVWSVCRHNRQCDVDFTWSPRKIHFPKNDTNSSWVLPGNKDMELPRNNLTKNEPNLCVPLTPNGGSDITNELLYTIQNALRIYSGSEVFLATSLDAFYPQEVIIEAAKLIQNVCVSDKLQCDLCKNRQPDMPDVIFLIKWMSDCNEGPLKKQFLSQNVLHVLLNLFPSPDSFLRRIPTDSTGKIKLIIPSLKKYLNELEAKLNDGEELSTMAGQDTNLQKEQELISGGWTCQSSNEKGHGYSYKVPIMLDIDVRMGKLYNSTKN